jgi:hypothetical protein
VASYKHNEPLIPKRLWLVQYEGKRTDYWYCKIYEGAGKRKYVVRSLKTEDKKTATDRAYEMYSEILQQVKDTGSASPKTVRQLCNRWIKRQEDRNAGGELSSSLFRAHRHIFSVYVPAYADMKGWKQIKQIPYDGWIEYRKWRKEEGWKLLGLDENGNVRNSSNKTRKPPKDSTVNREVTMIQEWFKYLLVPEKLVLAAPVISKTKQRREDLLANPPFEPSDYMKIQRRFRKWANEKNLTRVQKAEWRQVVYLFFLCTTNIGWRPDSEGLEMTWDLVKIRKRIVRLPNGEDKEEHIANLRIWDNKNRRWREGNFLGGEYFIRLKELYESLHASNPAFHKPEKTSLVFCDPLSGKRLNYTRVSYAYKKVLDSLGLKNAYTFYSCRSFYVTERLKEGVEIFTVAEQTGHSMEICKRHYARLDIQSRADEATKRTYGKKTESAGESLF